MKEVRMDAIFVYCTVSYVPTQKEGVSVGVSAILIQGPES